MRFVLKQCLSAVEFKCLINPA